MTPETKEQVRLMTVDLAEQQLLLHTRAESDAAPEKLNELAYLAGLELCRQKLLLLAAEAARKPVHHRVRDQLMVDRKLSRSQAEEDARSNPEFVRLVDEIDNLSVICARLENVRSVAFQRAALLVHRFWMEEPDPLFGKPPEATR